eukprot:scaffold584_cov132-Cylindrotheca_fusiformis.AAC.37
MTNFSTLLLSTLLLLALISTGYAKIAPFFHPFREDKPSSDLHKATKQTLKDRKHASVRRTLASNRSNGSSIMDEGAMRRVLSTKKSGSRSGSKSSKKSSSSKSSKKSTNRKGKGREHAYETEEPVKEAATEATVMSEDHTVSYDTPSDSNTNISEDRVVSDDTQSDSNTYVSEDHVVSYDTPSDSNNDDSEDRIVSDNTGGTIVSEDESQGGDSQEGDQNTDEEGAEDEDPEPQEDDAVAEEQDGDEDPEPGEDDAVEEEPEEDDAVEEEQDGEEGEGEPQEDDGVAGEEGPDDDEGTGEPVEEILVDNIEFAMVRYEAGTTDSAEEFRMTSTIVMYGLLHEITLEGEIHDSDSVGNFRAACTVVSLDNDVLCSYNMEMLTPGKDGIGELVARGHVTNHEANNVALVTGTSFDLAVYTKGGSLEMRPDPNDPTILYCTLTLRYVKTV